MKCPVDESVLIISERKSIEIDYCPTCRGVWLDRGELDKMIEKSEEIQQPVRNSERAQNQYDRNDDKGEHRNRGYGEDRNRHPQKKKRESFLGDMFDF